MADEIHIEQEGPEPDVRPGAADPAPAGRRPRSTAEAERVIDETRGRISHDLDEIEGRINQEKGKLEHKADELRRKADVLRPARQEVRRRPWPTVGAAAAAGLLLGILTGGEDEEAGRRHQDPLTARERGELHRLRAERRAMQQAEQSRRRASQRRKKSGDWKQDALEKFQRAALQQARSALTAALAGAVAGGTMKKAKDKMDGKTSRRQARQKQSGMHAQSGAPGRSTAEDRRPGTERPGADELMHSHTHER